MEQLPLFLDLSRKSCLVVGGGSVAERKVRLLLRARARVRVVAPVICEQLAGLNQDCLTLSRASFEPKMCEGQHLIIAATNQDQVNRKIAAAADHHGVWCNVVDDAQLSSALFPAIIDRSPITIAIGTGGTSPTLARRIKQRLEILLPQRIGELSAQAGRWRALVKSRLPRAKDRRLFWDRVFSGPIAQHLLAGRGAQAETEFQTQLATPAARRRIGEAYLVGAGPGDASLLTLRGHQLLSQADVVLYDALVSDQVLDFARKDAKRVCVGKRPGESNKQGGINRTLIRLVRKGHRVCRLKGGDPFVFGRGGEEAEALSNAGLAFEVVPGISAAFGCAAFTGIPLTHRDVSSSLTLATAISADASEPDWQLLARPGQTLALYMSVAAIDKVAKQLITHGMPGATPAALVENGTRSSQRVLEAELSQIAQVCAEQQAKSPAMLFVGEVVGLRSHAQKITLWNNNNSFLYPIVISA